MSDQPTIRVTAELRNNGSEWRASAYGGPMGHARDITTTAPTEDKVRALFIAEWNTAWGTEWTVDEFEFVVQPDGWESPTAAIEQQAAAESLVVTSGAGRRQR